MKIAGLVLASGHSRRIGYDKLQILFKGKPILTHVIDNLLSCPKVSETIVVRKPEDLASDIFDKRAKVIENRDHLNGMSTSLISGIKAMSIETEAFIMTMGDMPFVSTSLCNELIDAFESSPCKILVPVYKGKNGHPVIFSMDLKSQLLNIKGDIGARNIIKNHPEIVEYYPVTTEDILLDIDTNEDLERLNEYDKSTT